MINIEIKTTYLSLPESLLIRSLDTVSPEHIDPTESCNAAVPRPRRPRQPRQPRHTTKLNNPRQRSAQINWGLKNRNLRIRWIRMDPNGFFISFGTGLHYLHLQLRAADKHPEISNNSMLKNLLKVLLPGSHTWMHPSFSYRAKHLQYRDKTTSSCAVCTKELLHRSKGSQVSVIRCP